MESKLPADVALIKDLRWTILVQAVDKSCSWLYVVENERDVWWWRIGQYRIEKDERMACGSDLLEN